MANANNNESPVAASALSWSGIAMVLGLVLGFAFVGPKPLESWRQQPEGVALPSRYDLQDVDARLWQDPFEAALKHAHSGGGNARLRQCPVSDVGETRKVLAVMVSVTPYAESQEARLRARYAVLSALDVAGYAPEDDAHIGYCVLSLLPAEDHVDARLVTAAASLPLGRALDGSTGGGRPAPQQLLVPFEWFEPDWMHEERPDHKVLVLWLDDEKFGSDPLRRLAAVQRGFDGLPSARFRILGPARSSTLRAMIDGERAFGVHPAPNSTAISIFSPTATASMTLLVRGLGIDGGLRNPIRLVAAARTAGSEDAVAPEVGGAPGQTAFRLVRTTATDDQLAEVLVEELEMRGLQAGDSVALVGEWDTFYGRALRKAVSSRAKAKWKVHQFSYLRGIDGVLPKAGGSQSSRKDNRPERKPNGGTQERSEAPDLERPEGRSQLDYFRRLADRIRNLNAKRSMEGRGEIRAIGVLGSDVYDKLLILQALRDQFPKVVFFTTDLDARLLHPSQLAWTRNVVVASPFGLELDPEIQKDIPPFRDANQTALFYAALRALNFAELPANDGSVSTRASSRSDATAPTISLVTTRAQHELIRCGCPPRVCSRGGPGRPCCSRCCSSS